MRYLIFLTFIIASCTPQSGGNMKDSTDTKPTEMQTSKINADMLGYWKHSHEENSDGNRVYRNGKFKFPPSRGRFAFELQKGGKAIIYAIARGDGTDKQPGSWTLVGDVLTLNYEAGKRPAREFSVVSVAKDKLVVKPILR